MGDLPWSVLLEKIWPSVLNDYAIPPVRRDAKLRATYPQVDPEMLMAWLRGRGLESQGFGGLQQFGAWLLDNMYMEVACRIDVVRACEKKQKQREKVLMAVGNGVYGKICEEAFYVPYKRLADNGDVFECSATMALLTGTLISFERS